MNFSRVVTLTLNSSLAFAFFAPFALAVESSSPANPVFSHADDAELIYRSPSVLPVIQYEKSLEHRSGSPLYLPSRRIGPDEFSTQSFQLFVENMHMTMQAQNGVGLAANQVGRDLQVFMMETKAPAAVPALRAVPYTVYVNPVITKASENRVFFWHSCLSTAGADFGKVATFEWIEVQAQNERGVEIRAHLDGYAAIIFQHEFRHLLGGTYLDHAIDLLTPVKILELNLRKMISLYGLSDESVPLLIGDYKIGESLENYYARAARNLAP